MRERTFGVAAMALAYCASAHARAAGEPEDYDARAVTATAAAQIEEMTGLYRALCLRAFPDDDALDARMRERGARAMSEDEVKLFLHDDPGRGWALAGKGSVYHVTLELPPYHACSVRTTTRAGFDDLGPYRALIAAERAAWGDADAIDPIETDDGRLAQTVTGMARTRPDGMQEAHLVGVAQVTDPARRERLRGIEVRFVHQIVDPAEVR